MSYEHILVDVEDGVGILTLNRPDKLNAMNRKLSAELHDAVKAMDADDAVGCIVITGAGTKAFSAGGDIHEQREDDRRYTFEQLEEMRERPQRLRHRRVRQADDRHDERTGITAARPCCRPRSTCASAARTPSSASSPRRMGGSTAPGRWAAQIGWPMAKELLFTARVVEAEEAYRIGLLNHLVPREPAARQDDGDRAHDRRQPSRRGDGREGAAAQQKGESQERSTRWSTTTPRM